LSASGTNAIFFELKPNPNPMQHELVDSPFDQVNGYIAAPEEPGLGVTVREDVVKKYLMQ